MKNPFRRFALLLSLLLLSLLLLPGCVTAPAYQSKTFQEGKDLKKVVLLDPFVKIGTRSDGQNVEWSEEKSALGRAELAEYITAKLKERGFDIVRYSAENAAYPGDCERIWPQYAAVADQLNKRWQNSNRGPLPKIVFIPLDPIVVQRIAGSHQADGIVFVRFICARDSAGHKAKRIGVSVLIGALTLGWVVPIPFFDGSMVDMAFVDGKTGNIVWIDARNGPGHEYRAFLDTMIRMLPKFQPVQ